MSSICKPIAKALVILGRNVIVSTLLTSHLFREYSYLDQSSHLLSSSPVITEHETRITPKNMYLCSAQVKVNNGNYTVRYPTP